MEHNNDGSFSFDEDMDKPGLGHWLPEKPPKPTVREQLRTMLAEMPGALAFLGATHYEDENISSWTIKSDRMHIQTGDGGMLEMLKILKSELAKGLE